MKKKILFTLLIILIVIFIISICYIIKNHYAYYKLDKTNKDIQSNVVITNALSEPETHPPITVDFTALKKTNSDIIGWLYCADTPINYPVVRGKDNNQYLRTDINGKYNIGGTLFADYRNTIIENENNFIIYGHNMKNSSMFGSLVKYKKQDYYNAHPILYFLTPNTNYVIELYAGCVVDKDSDIYQLPTPKNIIENILSNSTFNPLAEEIDVSKIITLSTCSYEFDNARYVLIGRIKEI